MCSIWGKPIGLSIMKEELLVRIDNNHKHHASTEAKEIKFEQVREQTAYCAKRLVAICPEGRELSLALTHLEEAMFWANAAIARS